LLKTNEAKGNDEVVAEEQQDQVVSITQNNLLIDATVAQRDIKYLIWT